MKVEQVSKSIWNEFIYGGHLLSLGSVSVVFTSAILLNIKITWDFLLIIYLGAQSIYWYYQIQDMEYDYLTNFERCSHIKKYIKVIPYLIIFFIVFLIIILLCFNKLFVLLLYLSLLLVSAFYNNFFKILTKKIIGFKNLFIAFTETFLIFLLIVYYSFDLNLSVFLVLIFVYLRWLANTIFLDTKDIESDKKKGLLTIAIILKEKLVYFLKLITLLATLPIFIGVFWELLPKFSLLLVFTVPYTFYYLNIFRKQTGKISYILADMEFFLWSVFILLYMLILNL